MAVKKATTAKATPKAKIATAKDTTKAIETKAAVVVKATPEKKAPVKKVAKASRASKPVAVDVVFQFAGKDVTEKDVVKKVKEVWTKAFKRKVGEIKNIQLYVKAEDHKAYFVVNGEVSGDVDL